MKPKTEELLYLLLWTCNMAMRPTFRNLTDSFECWMYRNGFDRQLVALEKQHWLEVQHQSDSGRLHRLTEAGRLLALGERDPMVCWKRRWDGQWRMVLFDVPQSRASERTRLRRFLAARGFGYLQNSVWITPDPLTREREALGAGPVDVESLILLEARPCAGENNADIVRGAWDFDAINRRYEGHAEVLGSMPRQPIAGEVAARHWLDWLREERLRWSEAMRSDPLLPECLHLVGYQGVRIWKRRQTVMAEAGRRIRSFRPAP